MNFRKIIPHIRPNQVRWNMVPSTPACCVPVLPTSDVLGFDEANLKSRKTWGHKMADMIPKKGKERGACGLLEVKI